MESNSGPLSYESLFGGIPMTVTVADHRTRTVSEEVIRVRQLPIAAYQQAFACHEREAAMVALYADRPTEWVESLTPESYTRIAVEGRRLNADFFAYCDRQMESSLAATRRVSPDLFARLAEVAMRSKSSSPDSSTTSPLPPA